MQLSPQLYSFLINFIGLPFLLQIVVSLNRNVFYIDAFEKDFLSQHLVKYHTCPPNITLFSVGFFVFVEINFRASVQRSSHLSSHENRTCTLSCKPKITDFNISFHSHQNVIWLEISMHFSFLSDKIPFAFI